MTTLDEAIAHHGLAGVHDAAALLPLMSEDELEQLIVDVAAHGWRDPALKTQDNVLLDGRNRLIASMDDRITQPLPIDEVEVDDLEAIDLVLGRNLHRRQLKPAQKAMVVLDSRGLVARYEREAEERMNAGVSDPVAQVHQGTPGRTRNKLADIAGVGERTMASVMSAHNDPELAAAMRNGEMDAKKAEAEARKRKAAATPEEEWTDEEQAAKKMLEEGATIVVNIRSYPHLIAWADKKGLYEKVDRTSKWGNPFILPDDGNRETVIDNYRECYLPYKPSLNPKDLKGKALGCWCYPEACHGDVLKEGAEA
jgi:Domain of unknown function (DUF4326)